VALFFTSEGIRFGFSLGHSTHDFLLFEDHCLLDGIYSARPILVLPNVDRSVVCEFESKPMNGLVVPNRDGGYGRSLLQVDILTVAVLLADDVLVILAVVVL